MQSAGNDIIALGTINRERSNDSRFYTKILSASEQALYHAPVFAQMPFEHFLWLLWSIKESAYKYLKRGFPNLAFSPTKIIIQHIRFPDEQLLSAFEDRQWRGGTSDEACYKGSFRFGSTLFYFRSKIYPELIATVISEEKTFEHTWWGIRTIEGTGSAHQSKSVRLFLLEKLDSIVSGMGLRIEETAFGYPAIFQGTKELKLPVSLAHHGQFISYSFLSKSI